MELGAYAQAEQWAVRRWVSTFDGAVTISGHVGKVMPWGENWGGGCQALIVVDGRTVFSAAMDNRGTDYSITETVRIGTPVDFLFGPGPSIGVTKFTATIRSKQNSPTRKTQAEGAGTLSLAGRTKPFMAETVSTGRNATRRDWNLSIYHSFATQACAMVTFKQLAY